MKKNPVILLLALILAYGLVLSGCSADKAAGEDVPGETQTAEPSYQTTPEATPEPTPEQVPEQVPESSWEMVRDMQITHPTNVVTFITDDYGITGGMSGEFHYTVDGGQSWPEGENISACRYSLDALDENLTWSGGAGGHVRVTRDGGKTWEAVRDVNIGGTHTHISFIDDNTGWISVNKKFAITCDGGQTWTETDMPEGISSIAGIFLRTANEGYILSHDGQLCMTRDGGQTWTKQDLGLDRFKITDIKGKAGHLNVNVLPNADVSFADENNGIIVFIGMVPGESFKTFVLTTSDGGKTWADEALVFEDGYTPSSLTLSRDGKYLTLCDNDKRVMVMKQK